MAEVLLIRTITGFQPADDDARDAIKHHRIGSLIKADLPEMRNGKFFKKWWALVKVGFDYFEETQSACVSQRYKDKPILPNFERFRKDVIILTGHYKSVWNIKGELRLEADSLKWASMTEATFEKLYDKTVEVLLQNVLNKGKYQWTELNLRNAVERVLEFAA